MLDTRRIPQYWTPSTLPGIDSAADFETLARNDGEKNMARERLWTTERIEAFKEQWEAGVSPVELRRLYPEHTYRALESVAQRIGARRPARVKSPLQRMLRYLERNIAVTAVDIATDLALQTGEVRKIIKALHQEQRVHIAAYRGVSAMYALGTSEDVTRAQWAKLRKDSAHVPPTSTPLDTHPDGPRITMSRAEVGQRIPPRDPLMAAMYGKLSPCAHG